MSVHVNSEGERIEIVPSTAPAFRGQPLLVIVDDPPPQGSGVRAPMLLDEGTRRWLLEQLTALDAG